MTFSTLNQSILVVRRSLQFWWSLQFWYNALVTKVPLVLFETCTYGICNVNLRKDPYKTALKLDQLSDSEFDLGLHICPDGRVFEIPFTANGLIVPSAALHLNDLNLVVGQHATVPEKVLVSRLKNVLAKSRTTMFIHCNHKTISMFQSLISWLAGE